MGAFLFFKHRMCFSSLTALLMLNLRQSGGYTLPMLRIAMGVEYDGSQTHGWQFQSHDPNTLQQAVEASISKVANHPVRVICAGRTDAGVHASQQVIHFDTTAKRAQRAWVMGTNTTLPDSISIRWAMPVDPAFHARFQAVSRRYRYILFNHPVRQALFAKQLSWEFRPLDVGRMQAAADCLVGEHDFTSYRATGCQAKSPVRTIESLNVNRKGDLVFIDIQANGFLHHMVRNIVGVLSPIGCGNRPVEWAAELLTARDRRLAGVTAPPYGLYFVGPIYPDHYHIPEPKLPLVGVP